MLAMAEPLEELPDRDHGDEDQADDKHREDDVPPLLGDISGREEPSDHTATLTDATAVRVERRLKRVLAHLTHDEVPQLPRLAAQAERVACSVQLARAEQSGRRRPGDAVAVRSLGSQLSSRRRSVPRDPRRP